MLCSFPLTLCSAAASELPEARTTSQHTAGKRDGTQAILRNPLLPGLGTKSGQLPAQPSADPTAGVVIGHEQCPSCQNCPWLKQQLYLSHGKPAFHSRRGTKATAQAAELFRLSWGTILLHGKESAISSCFRQLKIPFRSLCPPFHHSASPWATLGLCHCCPPHTGGQLLQPSVGHEPHIAVSQAESSCPTQGVFPGGIPICLHV